MVDGTKNVLVMFHYKTCGHCQTIEPEYEEAAAILTESDEVVMAWVDTEDYPEIPERYGVTGAPVFKFFAKGTVEADKFYYVHYNGRMGNTLLKMLGDRVEGFTKKLPPMKDYVTKVDGAGFDAAARDPSKKVVLCYLYPSWSESDTVKLVMRRVGEAFEGEDSVAFVKMPIQTIVERDVTEKYAFSDYPGFMAFYDGGTKWEKYTGGVDVTELVAYLNAKAGTARAYSGPGVHRPSGVVAAMARFASARPVTAEVVAEAEAALAAIVENSSSGGGKAGAENAKTYVKTLKKILENGEGYVATEIKRIDSLLAKGSITPQKKTSFLQRRDVLQSFAASAAEEADGGGSSGGSSVSSGGTAADEL